MVWPRTSLIAAACSRALESTPPPGAKGTISVIGWFGQFAGCAAAAAVRAASNAAPSAARIGVMNNSSFSVEDDAAGLDRSGPAFQLGFDEGRQIVRRAAILGGDDHADILVTLD